MKLKRNLIVGANIFAGGTDLADIPEQVQRQIPQSEIEGEPEVISELTLPPTLRRMKLDQLLVIAAQHGIEVPDDMTRMGIIEQLEALR